MDRRSATLDDGVTGDLVPLNALPTEHRQELIRGGRVVSLAPGETFSRPADEDGTTFYLLDGELELLREGRSVLTLAGGTPPARFALSQLRNPRVEGRAVTPVRLLGVDMSMLSTLLIWAQSRIPGAAGDAPPAGWSTDWLPRLLRSELCAIIPPANLDRIFESFEPVEVNAGDRVIRQGDPGDFHYVVASGRCEVTRERPRTGEQLRLAMLGPGDSFGEEALITGASRNASVTMLSDGTLLRLTKDAFLRLVIDPALSVLDRAGADAAVAGGSRWLDVRLPEEHAHDGLAGSTCIPLGELRARSDELDRSASYVAYCDTGRRSSVAGYLLGQLGFATGVLAGGLEAPAAPAEPGAESPAGAATVDAGTRAAALRSELVAADSELEEALRRKVEATAERRIWMRDAAEEPPADEAKRRHAKVAAKLKAEQRRLELQSTDAGRVLAQAQQKKLEAEAAIRAEEARAARERAKAEAACKALRDEAELRLKSEQQRLEAEYARAEARMEELGRTRGEAEAEYEQERARLEREFAEQKARMDAEARELESTMESARRAVEEGARQIRDKQSAAEAKIRTETEARLRAERERLELEFAQSARRIESAQQQLDRIATEKGEAAERARRFRTDLAEEADRRRRETEAEYRERRDELERRARDASDQIETAAREKEKAEEARRRLKAELDALVRAKKPAADEESLESDIEAQQEAAEKAAASAAAATRARLDLERKRAVDEEKMATERLAEEELRVRLLSEAQDWLEVEDRDSKQKLDAAQRQVEEMARRQREAQERARQIEVENSNLLSEIETQLKQENEALREALGEEAYAATLSSSADEAQARADQEKRRAAEALERARQHIERLRKREE